MFITKLFIAVGIVWPVSEILLGLFKRAKGTSAVVKDRGSLAVLWGAIGLGFYAGFRARFGSVGSMGVPLAVFESVGLVFLLSGLVLRWSAVITLGRLFTANVAVHEGQRVVRTGVYRHVRHPAYSGLLLAFAGVGVGFGNWLSLVFILVPIAAALAYRIRVEEAALLEALGSEYADYCKVTKRLIPGVY
jgi:protein-S-isoprenylcysteine O-methyltransferase Ste14